MNPVQAKIKELISKIDTSKPQNRLLLLFVAAPKTLILLSPFLLQGALSKVGIEMSLQQIEFYGLNLFVGAGLYVGLKRFFEENSDNMFVKMVEEINPLNRLTANQNEESDGAKSTIMVL